MRPLLQSPFHMATVFLLFLVPNGKAFIRAIYNRNSTSQDFSALPALFGPPLAGKGLTGYLIEVMPANACHPIESPPAPRNSSTAFIVLIRTYDCTFGAKVRHAQQAGYRAAIVHNVNSQALVDMAIGMEEIQQRTEIPSVFTGEATSKLLRKVCRSDEGTHVILVPEYYHFAWEEDAGNSCPRACRCRIQLLGHCSQVPILPVCRAISILVAIVTGILLIVKYTMGYHIWRKRRRRKRRNPLREEQGKESSTSTFKRGAKYTECAICLEMYEKGDMLKILSCSHAYHGKCIDLWLLTQTRNKTCPLCMQRVTVAAESPDLDIEECIEEERDEGNQEGEEDGHNREGQ
ncbi:E3 ubiquitin-protein ligase RNF167-like [Trachemys scripta elegans]|uniref:E3 ubiquitin-protein ligase RNF167-like n=1 Tax=Trachemys scripta elegans TaxID=31138 RepID=UPI0015539808|nr:E3 ubiquitin-protein ligase RNF167-like [Trachemys scripta elegans]